MAEQPVEKADLLAVKSDVCFAKSDWPAAKACYRLVNRGLFAAKPEPHVANSDSLFAETTLREGKRLFARKSSGYLLRKAICTMQRLTCEPQSRVR